MTKFDRYDIGISQIDGLIDLEHIEQTLSHIGFNKNMKGFYYIIDAMKLIKLYNDISMNDIYSYLSERYELDREIISFRLRNCIKRNTIYTKNDQHKTRVVLKKLTNKYINIIR